MCGEASSVQERKLDRGTDRATTSFVPSHLVTVSEVTKDKTFYKIIYFLRCFAWLSVSLNNTKLGADQTHSERRFEPFTRRLSMDSLMSEDEYNYHQRVERDPFRSVKRRRDIEDYHQSEYQEYHPSQTRHRALQCDGEFEPSFDNDRVAVIKSPYFYHCYDSVSESFSRVLCNPQLGNRTGELSLLT